MPATYTSEMLAFSDNVLSFFMKGGYSLRYEITFGLVLLVVWCMMQLASLLQKPNRILKKLTSPENSPRAAGKESTLTARFGGSKVADVALTHPPIAQSKRIDQIDPALLRSPSWLVPQVTQMCRAQVQQAFALYRAALSAGLKLQDVPQNDCENLFVALITSAIRTCQMDEAMQFLRDLRQQGLNVSTSLFCSVAKLCTSKHLFAECLAVYDFLVEDPNFLLMDRTIWSCLLFCAIEVQAYDRCAFFFERLRACGVPSHKDYGNMVRLASLQGDWQLSVRLVQDMRETSVELDSVIFNTCLAACVGAGQVDRARLLIEEVQGTEMLADVITYNTLMKGYAKAGRMDECFEVYKLLKTRSVTASQVTYGILLDGFINENQFDRAVQVFNIIVQEGCTMNTVLYTTLIKGFARAGVVDHAMKVYERMRTERNVTPDLITFSILIKANCDADHLEEGLKLLEAMITLNLRPDEVVFNSLLAGCAKQANAKLGKRLYADMLSCGIRPSNATFSILIRLFHQCKILEDAVEMLRSEPGKHKVDPEPRVFLQLIQSCIRERQGRRAVEVYEMLAEQSSPTASTHSNVITTCVKLNMYDTAAEILGIAAAKRFRVDSRDADALLDGAVRKHKTQVAQDIATSMTKLNLTVGPKLQAALASQT